MQNTKMKTVTILLVWVILILTCKSPSEEKPLSTQNPNTELPSYNAVKIESAIIVDGKMDEPAWQDAMPATFNYYYRDEKPSDKQKSTFRLMWDEQHLFLFYQFEDKYLTAREVNRDGEPYLDDCAEIFLIPVPEALDTHFCFEVNIYKATNDILFFNDYYKGSNVGFKPFNPVVEIETTYLGTINDNSDIDTGWAMEMKIPISIFGFLANFEPLKPGNSWRFLAIRQERNEVEGSRRTTSTIFEMPKNFNDVHVPSHFGVLNFVQ